MADHAFNEGDEVQHKTGRIKMIYIGEGRSGEALCEWTDPSGKPQRDSFAYLALKKYEAPKRRAVLLGRS
ncbi:MAG: hypothetical protein Q7V31_07450 [Parvibaculum sp.]|uniref:hypothetical protein n=1 Tax=Parvibaculum sp. TaxID=2024848 RepID=UPI00271DD318|nr:hypothetical protein [Parvibaculum sp.]MDO8838751.1 hypothetical protein [Parvibaculum sp.]